MSGLASLVFTVLGVFSHWFEGIIGAHNARTFCWIAAVLCFLFANYRNWADEHKKVLSQRLDFDFVIEQMHWELIQNGESTAFVFAVFLLNKGAPSITRSWRATYKISSSTEWMKLFYLPDKWIIKSDSQSVTIQPQDQIAAKTIEKRVETGDAKTGRVFFSLPGDRGDQIKSLQFEIEITFSDFLGNDISAKFKPNPAPLVGISLYPTEMGTIEPNRVDSPQYIPPLLPAKNEDKGK